MLIILGDICNTGVNHVDDKCNASFQLPSIIRKDFRFGWQQHKLPFKLLSGKTNTPNLSPNIVENAHPY